jgi:hypothetical protein
MVKPPPDPTDMQTTRNLLARDVMMAFGLLP